jgi:Arc/MetJ-type ribon-helix-helix transcriptional regulator
MTMTTRLTVSLPDDLHAQLLRVAVESHISASAVIRAVLSDLLPKMTGILDYLATNPPTKEMVGEADAWARDVEAVLQSGPEVFGGLRHLGLGADES